MGRSERAHPAHRLWGVSRGGPLSLSLSLSLRLGPGLASRVKAEQEEDEGAKGLRMLTGAKEGEELKR